MKHFDLDYKIEQFRNEHLQDLFDENGKRYTGVRISNGQAETMLEIINELQHFYDSSKGLYVIDKCIDNFFTELPDEKDCKTVVEAFLVQEFKKLKSLIYKL
jgi:hypothetical protein